MNIGIEIGFQERFDVAVIGGGPSGCAAAIAAAREGAKTLLVEATGALGGMGTSGLVPCWCPFSDHKRIVCGGIAQRIGQLAVAQVKHVRPSTLDWTPIDPEALKRIYDQQVIESGAKIWFNSLLVKTTAGAGKVSSLLIARKNQLRLVVADVYLDCTGDGDLCAAAGAEFEHGDTATGETQPSTLCFAMANVDTYEFLNHRRPQLSDLRERADRSKYPRLGDLHLVTFLVGPGIVGFNAGHMWGLDHAHPETIDLAMVEGRLIASEYAAAMREYFPAFRNATLVATANLMGIRESRRITGDYILNINDYLKREKFPDQIGVYCYPIDIHNSRAEVTAVLNGADLAMNRYPHYLPGEYYGIPWRCLTPRRLKNVIVAGRCISADHEMQASLRTMPACMVTGEAAGCAAAMILRMQEPDVHQLDTRVLRKRLLEHGAYLGEDSGETAGNIVDPQQILEEEMVP